VSEVPATAPFKRAVLGLNGGPTDSLVVKVGCQLARPHKAELIALHIVEVDWSHDLAEDVASDNVQASTVLDMAEGIGEKAQVPMRTELLQARDVGAALVDEAVELDADLIVLGLPYRKKFGGDFAIGRTVPYVLQNAPCLVVVVREPMTARDTRETPRQLVGSASRGSGT
jgi:nucleotide-binding universal stress UspA family protein